MVTYVLGDKVNQSGGIEWPLLYIGKNVPSITLYILFFIWFAITSAGFLSQKRQIGRANLLMWGSIGGLITTTGAFILYLFPLETPLISLPMVVIILSSTLIINFLFWIINFISDNE